MKTEREPGYYWVSMDNEAWNVAEWTGSFWFVTGTDTIIENITYVDERRITRDPPKVIIETGAQFWKRINGAIKKTDRGEPSGLEAGTISISPDFQLLTQQQHDALVNELGFKKVKSRCPVCYTESTIKRNLEMITKRDRLKQRGK